MRLLKFLLVGLISFLGFISCNKEVTNAFQTNQLIEYNDKGIHSLGPYAQYFRSNGADGTISVRYFDNIMNTKVMDIGVFLKNSYEDDGLPRSGHFNVTIGEWEKIPHL